MLKFFITNIPKDNFLSTFSAIAEPRFMSYDSNHNQSLLTQSLRQGTLKENLHLINVNITYDDPNLQLLLRSLIEIQFQDNDLIYINLNDLNVKKFPELFSGDQRIFIDADQLDQDSFFTDLFYHPSSPFKALQELSVEYQKLALVEIADLVCDKLPTHFLFDHLNKSYISVGSQETIKSILQESHLKITKIIFDHKVEMIAEKYYKELMFAKCFKENKFLLILSQNQFSFFEDQDLRETAQSNYQHTLDNFLEYSSSNTVYFNTEIAQEFVENITDIFIRHFERKLKGVSEYLFNAYQDLDQENKGIICDLAIKKFAEGHSNNLDSEQILVNIAEYLENKFEDHSKGKSYLRRSQQQPNIASYFTTPAPIEINSDTYAPSPFPTNSNFVGRSRVGASL